MKKLILILLLLTISKPVFAQVWDSSPPPPLLPSINMAHICKIESGGNIKAYNARGRAYGLYQITKPCLEEYNKLTRHNHVLRDLFNPAINTAVASWYLNKRIPQLLRHYRLPVNHKNIIWAYNAGIGNVRRGILPKETRKYLLKYEKLIKQGV